EGGGGAGRGGGLGAEEADEWMAGGWLEALHIGPERRDGEHDPESSEQRGPQHEVADRIPFQSGGIGWCRSRQERQIGQPPRRQSQADPENREQETAEEPGQGYRRPQPRHEGREKAPPQAA